MKISYFVCLFFIYMTYRVEQVEIVRLDLFVMVVSCFLLYPNVVCLGLKRITRKHEAPRYLHEYVHFFSRKNIVGLNCLNDI